jgi:hypothetical protein
MAISPPAAEGGRVRRRRCRRPLPSEPDGRRFDASGSSMKQRTVKHAVNLIGLEGHLHVTRTEPAPEMPRWWQPHQQGPLQSRRHLCVAAQRRLAVLSRASTPEGSLPGFPWGDVATPIRSVTDRPWLPPSSFTRSPIGSPCGSLSLAGKLRAYHVPLMYPGGVGRISPPVVRHLRRAS